jgi:hypothetical protein
MRSEGLRGNAAQMVMSSYPPSCFPVPLLSTMILGNHDLAIQSQGLTEVQVLVGSFASLSALYDV